MTMSQRRTKSQVGRTVFRFFLEEHFGAILSRKYVVYANIPDHKPRFMGQGSYGILMVARAVFATASILGVLIFAVFRVIIWPWSETGIVPVKTLVGTDLRWDFQSINPSWNVFVVRCHFRIALDRN